MALIEIHHHHHHHYPELEAMNQQLQNLTDRVSSLRSTVTSAVALLLGLASQIESLKNDPAALQALADDLRDQNQSLADAVARTDGDDATQPSDYVPPVDPINPTPIGEDPAPVDPTPVDGGDTPVQVDENGNPV